MNTWLDCGPPGLAPSGPPGRLTPAAAPILLLGGGLIGGFAAEVCPGFAPVETCLVALIGACCVLSWCLLDAYWVFIGCSIVPTDRAFKRLLFKTTPHDWLCSRYT